MTIVTVRQMHNQQIRDIGVLGPEPDDGWYYAWATDYDLDLIVGVGKTPLDAIVHLLDQIEERT